jgi:hypothetical protein
MGGLLLAALAIALVLIIAGLTGWFAGQGPPR